MPASTSPMTGGCPMAAHARPSRRPTASTETSAIVRCPMVSTALSGATALRQHELVRLVRLGGGRRAFVPRRNRPLARLVERFERRPDLVHAAVEEVADEEIGERA